MNVVGPGTWSFSACLSFHPVFQLVSWGSEASPKIDHGAWIPFPAPLCKVTPHGSQSVRPRQFYWCSCSLSHLSKCEAGGAWCAVQKIGTMGSGKSPWLTCPLLPAPGNLTHMPKCPRSFPSLSYDTGPQPHSFKCYLQIP